MGDIIRHSNVHKTKIQAREKKKKFWKYIWINSGWELPQFAKKKKKLHIPESTESQEG